MFSNQPFREILHFYGAAAVASSPNNVGRSYGSPAPFVDSDTLFILLAYSMVHHCYAIVDVAVTGTSDLDVGPVGGDVDGFLDGSASLTLGTPGMYGYFTNAGALVGAGVSYYSAVDVGIRHNFTTTNTAGKMRIVIEGVRFNAP